VPLVAKERAMVSNVDESMVAPCGVSRPHARGGATRAIAV
jgi:hypothetical protein